MKFIADGIIITLFWFLAIYVFKKDSIDKLCKIDIHKDVLYKLMISTKTVVILMLLLEVITAISPAQSTIINVNNALRLPFISHIILLMEIFLIFTYGYLFSTLYSKDKTNKNQMNIKTKRLGIGNGLTVVGGYIFLFGIKSILWGNFAFLYSTNGNISYVKEFIFTLVLILIPGLIIMIKGFLYIPVRSTVFNTFAFNVLLVVGHDIIIKVVIIMEIVNFFHRSILSEEVTEEEDILLLHSSSTVGSYITRVNSYFVYGFTLTIPLLWAFQTSPFKPSFSLYANGSFVSVFLQLAIVVFCIIEIIGRMVGKYGDVVRGFYIPIAVFLIVFPFYTNNTLVSAEAIDVRFESLYHMIVNGLGDKSFLFFIALIILQGAVGYCIYIVTGTAKRKKNFYAILPMIIILQVILVTVSFTIFAIFPPFIIVKASKFIIGLFVILAILFTVFISNLTYRFFTYEKIKWDIPVIEFFRNLNHLYLIVGLSTVLIFVPLVLQILYIGKSYNVAMDWDVNLELDNDAKIQEYIYDTDLNQVTFLCNKDNSTEIITVNLEDQMTIWKKNLSFKYNTMVNLEDNLILLLKENNEGALIINSDDGTEVYRYNPVDISELEFFEINHNSRALIIIEGTNQYIYDTKYGEIPLETIGNNFYELMAGNQLIISKSDKLYKYNGQEFIEMGSLAELENAKYYEFNDNGLYVVNNRYIVNYDYTLNEINQTQYKEGNHNVLSIEKSNNEALSDELLITVASRIKNYCVIFDSNDNSIDLITLEQKIKSFVDIQSFSVSRDKNYYALYDSNQFTIFDGEINISRFWLGNFGDDVESIKLAESLEPLMYKNSLLWISNNGKLYNFEYEK